MSDIAPPVPVATVMRDGIELAADLYLPQADRPQPAVLLRTPYARSLFEVEAAPLTSAGYAVVVQSVRGRHGSQGDWHPYFGEGPDGFDSVEWVAAQPWCDGRVGMIGASYGGWTQWAAARERPSALRTFISSVCCARWTGEWPWADGVLFPGAITWLHLVDGSEDQDLGHLLRRADEPTWPLERLQDRYDRRLPMGDEWLRNPRPSDYWAPITMTPADFAGIEVPVLHVTGWFDGCQRGSHFLFEGMRAHSPAAADQALLVGPWEHAVREMKSSCDGVDFGRTAVVDYYHERIRWFDRWLRGDPVQAPPVVRAFATGSNRWLELPDLPEPSAREGEWFLRGDGALTDVAPDETEPPRSYVYDPRDPVPTRPADAPGAHPFLDRTPVHARDDVLVWESATLPTALRIAGAGAVEVWIATDVEDTDVFVEVADVDPAGRRLLVAHGRIRARYRDGEEQPLTPGEVTKLLVELVPRVHDVLPGHRLAVAVTSSGAPLWAPHPNSAGDLWTAREVRVARTQVHSGPATRSMLRLPVVAAEH